MKRLCQLNLFIFQRGTWGAGWSFTTGSTGQPALCAHSKLNLCSDRKEWETPDTPLSLALSTVGSNPQDSKSSGRRLHLSDRGAGITFREHIYPTGWLFFWVNTVSWKFRVFFIHQKGWSSLALMFNGHSVFPLLRASNQSLISHKFKLAFTFFIILCSQFYFCAITGSRLK